MTAGEGETSLDSFPADSAAANRATELTLPQTRVLKGVLGSAHQINREADRIAYLRSQWKTDTEDMESAHVAMCAYLLSTPVVGFRVVNGTPETAAAFTLKFVEAWK